MLFEFVVEHFLDGSGVPFADFSVVVFASVFVVEVLVDSFEVFHDEPVLFGC